MSGPEESRLYPSRPLVGVGAVVFRGDRVLLVKRGRAPRQGVWTFPGGLMEIGETVFQAAQRELQEETGITATPVDTVTVYEVIERDEEDRVRYHYVVLEVLLLYEGGSPRPGDDAEDVRWFPLDALDDPAVGPGVKEVVEKALALLRGRAPVAE